MADLTSMLPSDGENFTDLINSGEFSFEDFLKEDLLPQPTIESAPAPDPKKTVSQPQDTQKTDNQPSVAEQQELQKIEKLLLELGEEIKRVGGQPGAEAPTLQTDTNKTISAPTTPLAISPQESLVDQMLQEPLDSEDSKKVEVVPPSSGNLNLQQQPINPNVINQTEFNNERLVYLKEMEKSYLEKRQEILNQYNTSLQTDNQINQSFAGDQNSEFNTPSFTDINNVTDNSLQQAGSQTDLTNNTDNFSETLNQTTNNQTQNFDINNVSNTPVINTPDDPFVQADKAVIPPEQPALDNNVENIFTDISNTNIDNTSNNNTAFNSDNNTLPVEEPKSFDSENLNNQFTEAFSGTSAENIQSELPPAGDPVAGNAQEIIKILQGIQTGINKLGDTLGSKFSNLDQSIKNVSTTVNNYNNTSRQQGSSFAENNNTSDRQPIPDYRGDYAQSSDFPPDFDVSNMGGKNLGNIPQIV